VAASPDQQKLERARRKRELERFPDFKEWLAERDPELAEEWRYRQRQQPMLEGPAFEQPTPRDIRAFESEVNGRIVNYRLASKRGQPAFTDRGRVIDVRDSTSRETVLAALQLSAQKWGTFTVYGDEQFRRFCVELAVEHGFGIANPELQNAIVEERARLRVEHEHRPIRRPVATSIGEAYKLHLADIARNATAGRSDPSRLDAEVAVRLRLTGHDRDAIARVIKHSVPALRPGERRDWDCYARRAVDFAFGLPGSRVLQQFERQRQHLLSVEGRSLEEQVPSRRRGRAPLGR
jgi:hypothetical protein